MLRCDGKDIVKKSSTRKGRYLLVFNFQLAPAAAGKLVRLAALSTRMRWSDGWGCRVQGADCATLGQQRCCSAPHLPPDHACQPPAPHPPIYPVQGALAQLDSKNPVMYLDFPQGRYKMFGASMRQCRQRDAVLRLLCLRPGPRC